MKIEKNTLKLKRLICELLVHEIENTRIISNSAYAEIIASSKRFVKTNAFRELTTFAISDEHEKM